MGGDFAQRRQFVADAAAGMAADAVLEILKAAAETSQQAISHSLVRLLSKLAAHAESGSEEIRPQAEAALREQVQRLLQGWTLADPNPGVYGAALQRMSRAAPTGPAAPACGLRRRRAPARRARRRPVGGRAPRAAGTTRPPGAGDRAPRRAAPRRRPLVCHPQSARAARGPRGAPGRVLAGALRAPPGRAGASAGGEAAAQAAGRA